MPVAEFMEKYGNVVWAKYGLFIEAELRVFYDEEKDNDDIAVSCWKVHIEAAQSHFQKRFWIKNLHDQIGHCLKWQCLGNYCDKSIIWLSPLGL